MDRTYDEFETHLKDLLSWYHKAVTELARKPTDNEAEKMSVANARQAIITHCRRFDKKRKQEHGIL